MSIFDFDREISFADYVNTITVYGEMYKPTPQTAEGLLALAKNLKASILAKCAERRFDIAYYYSIEALQIFDSHKTAVPLKKTDPAVKPILMWLLDTTEAIKAKGLPVLYRERIADVRAREPMRQQILAQQMELDAAAQHNLRRQQLLKSTTAEADQLLDALGGTTAGFYGALNSDHNATQKNSTVSTSATPPLSQYGAAYGYTPASLLQTTTVPIPSPTVNQGAARTWRFPNSPGTAPVPRGIVNLGNTCYMNSVLQVMNATPLATFFLSNEYISELVDKVGNYSRVVNAFSFVLRELRRKGCAFAVSPSSLKSAVAAVYEPFKDYKQQDANEFLRVVLDAVHSGLNANAGNRAVMPDIDNTTGTDDQLARTYWWQYAQKNASVVVDMCGFQERSMITCPQCGRCSRSFSATLGIEVPVASGNNMTLEKCLQTYCATETLDNDSLYQCPGCKRRVNAQKQLQLYSVPQILFITLKRFQHMGDFSNVAKVTSNVYFQQHLDMKPFMCSNFPSTKYELIGIVNHQGNMHGGHYTADVCSDQTWFHTSDEVVTKASAPDPSLAYILCYRRCS